MEKGVLGGSLVVFVVAVAQDVGTVGVGLGGIVAGNGFLVEGDVVVGIEPAYVVDVHIGHAYVELLKLVELVGGREDEGTLMGVLAATCLAYVRLHADAPVGQTVLHDIGAQLAFGIADVQAAVAYGEANLLV